MLIKNYLFGSHIDLPQDVFETSDVVARNERRSRILASQGGTRNFKRRVWSNGAKSQDPKKFLGLPAKPKKSLDRKLTPQKTHADFVALKSSQAKEIKSSLKQKGTSVTVKPIDWIEVVEVLYTAGY